VSPGKPADESENQQKGQAKEDPTRRPAENSLDKHTKHIRDLVAEAKSDARRKNGRRFPRLRDPAAFLRRLRFRRKVADPLPNSHGFILVKADEAD
jgi:hypothetical protein